MTALIEFFGRLHPIILHAPIGLFIAVAATELSAMLRRGPRPEYAPLLLVYLTALTMLGAAATGYILSREDGYGGKTLDLHFWGGLVSAGFSVLVVVFRQRTARVAPSLDSGDLSRMAAPVRPWYANDALLYRYSLVLLGGFLTFTGHLGGTMTHGENFLFEPFQEARTAREPRTERIPAPSQEVGASPEWNAALAVFDAKCNMCHGESKQKGGLAMHTLEAINAGGTTGTAYEPGDPENSELLIRIHLDPDHDDHMPPLEKPQLTEAEIKIITDWIIAAKPSASAAPIPSSANTPSTAGPEASHGATPRAKAAAMPDPAALRALREARVHVASLTPDEARLWLDFSTVSPRLSAPAIGSLLQPLLPYVVHLNVAGCELPDTLGDQLREMTRLERLDLRGTAADDTLIGSLADHPALRELVLVQTKAGDGSIDAIASMRELTTLYVWNSGLSSDGLARLRTRVQGVRIDAGDAALSAATESEGELKFSSDGGTPQASAVQTPASPVPSAVASLKPINDTCPVSGSPVDPRYMVVYEGKVIGFCCPNCPKQFWTDPQKFLSALKK